MTHLGRSMKLEWIICCCDQHVLFKWEWHLFNDYLVSFKNVYFLQIRIEVLLLNTCANSSHYLQNYSIFVLKEMPLNHWVKLVESECSLNKTEIVSSKYLFMVFTLLLQTTNLPRVIFTCRVYLRSLKWMIKQSFVSFCEGKEGDKEITFMWLNKQDIQNTEMLIRHCDE